MTTSQKDIRAGIDQGMLVFTPQFKNGQSRSAVLNFCFNSSQAKAMYFTHRARSRKYPDGFVKFDSSDTIRLFDDKHSIATFQM